LVASEATILLTVLQVTAEDQVVRLLFEAVPSFIPPAGVNPNYNVWLNAIELNTVDMNKLAKNPWPGDADMHVDADSGSLMLSWSPASASVEKHYLFLGTDKTSIENADTTDATLLAGIKAYDDTTFLLADPYSMNTYYWRVDELDQNGVLTKGNVWSFRPRQLAFRGAEGYGRFATGGRGGKVVYVTNLNDSGEGSFREAVTSDIGPRTVVFNVSGIITLNSRLFVSNNYITIAGQTAPGKGICFRSAPFGISDENICRFIRSRLGGGDTGDGMGMTGANHSITDHCSVSWSIDEAFSSRDAKNITLQRSMISEALNCAGHKNYPEGAEHGYAATISGRIGSYHHNLLAHCNGRNWSIGAAIDGSNQWVSQLDIFNNVVYNWGSRTTDGEVHKLNFVNNYYKMGAASTKTTILRIDVLNFGWGTEQGYYAGNVIQRTDGSFLNDGSSNTIGREYTIGTGVVTPLTYEVYVNEPFFPSYATIETAKDAYKSVLSDVGCTMPMFDEHDQRIIRETLNGTYTYVGSKTGKKGLIDNEADAGGYEDYGNETRPEGFDSDWDGLPDWWEDLHGSNPHSAEGDFSDANADPDRDGYTALEDYLEWMSVPRYYMNKNSQKSIDLAPYAIAYTKNPQFSTASATDLSLNFSGSVVNATPVGDFTGISYFDFTVTDSDNSSMTRRIGVYVQEDTATALSAIQHKELEFKVYPSTFSSELNIETQARESKEINLILRDLNGREVLREYYSVNAGRVRLQIKCPTGLPTQMYLLELNDAQTGMKYDVKKVFKK
ncbi:MAG: T9SS C-terminal target domain-containing protein, partial [Bacteroidales bacterium]|nr:T9SS C-terminal target domain-containing protein [Bacteroidales bacterium]